MFTIESQFPGSAIKSDGWARKILGRKDNYDFSDPDFFNDRGIKPDEVLVFHYWVSIAENWVIIDSIETWAKFKDKKIFPDEVYACPEIMIYRLSSFTKEDKKLQFFKTKSCPYCKKKTLIGNKKIQTCDHCEKRFVI